MDTTLLVLHLLQLHFSMQKQHKFIHHPLKIWIYPSWMQQKSLLSVLGNNLLLSSTFGFPNKTSTLPKRIDRKLNLLKHAKARYKLQVFQYLILFQNHLHREWNRTLTPKTQESSSLATNPWHFLSRSVHRSGFNLTATKVSNFVSLFFHHAFLEGTCVQSCSF